MGTQAVGKILRYLSVHRNWSFPGDVSMGTDGIAMSTVYAVLRRMDKAGLVISKESDMRLPDGRTRKLYRVSKLGRKLCIVLEELNKDPGPPEVKRDEF